MRRTRSSCPGACSSSAVSDSIDSTCSITTTGTATRSNAPDNLVSPRVGVVFKPVTPLSLYGTYSVSYLPSSGDQFSSLTNITQQVKPERFNNYEVGAKWDVMPDLALTTAVYRLDRTNTRSTDPNDPTRIVQTGSQRTNGYELGVNGRIAIALDRRRRLRVSGCVRQQRHGGRGSGRRWSARCRITRCRSGTTCRVHPRMTAGIGIVNRTDMFAAIDNTVTLPGYTRADAAAFVTLSPSAPPADQRRESVRQAGLPERGQQHEYLAGRAQGGPGRADGGVLSGQPKLLLMRIRHERIRRSFVTSGDYACTKRSIPDEGNPPRT